MGTYNILGNKVKDYKYNIINRLLNGEYGFNPVCECGAIQTYSGLNDQLKSGELTKSQYKCWYCTMSRKVSVNGITYDSIAEATNKLFNETLCKCKLCKSPINYKSLYQRIQDSTFTSYDDLICNECNKTIFANNVSDYLVNAHSNPNSGFNTIEFREYKSKLFKEQLSKCKTYDSCEFGNIDLRLAKELYRYNCNHEAPTCIYIGYIDKNSPYMGLNSDKYFKIGITSDVTRRGNWGGVPSGISKYQVLREFPNRRQAALCEYLSIKTFGVNDISEAAELSNLHSYESYVLNFNYDKEKIIIKDYLLKYYPNDLN